MPLSYKFWMYDHLASINLIPKIDLVNRSNLAKPNEANAGTDLAPLELIHFDLCEMNGEMIKSDKRYFIMFIDDCTRFCYVYLLKSKNEAFHYFKIYKAEIENQLDKKIKQLIMIWLEGRNFFKWIF